MIQSPPQYYVRLSDDPQDIRAAQRLRYQVFVEELGSTGPAVDHEEGLEKDRFDAFAIHVLLSDLSRPRGDQIIGVYRVLTEAAAARAGQFYCEDEYDLTPLRRSGLTLLELGRSCLHPDYRGGEALVHLWSGLAEFIAAHKIDLLFGVASFNGTEVARHANALALLHDRYLAPEDLRPMAKPPAAVPLAQRPIDQVDRVAAMRDMPALIKAYLRLGGQVGQGAFVDHAFNTTDICIVLRADAVGALQRQIYARGVGLG